MDATSRRWLSIAIVCLGVIGAGAAVVLVEHPQMGTADEGVNTADTDEVDADFFIMQIDLEESGDADWSVVFQHTLEDDTEVESFHDLQAELEDGTAAHIETFENRMLAMIAAASDATDREMELSNLTVETDTEQRPQNTIGSVNYQFKWSNFSAVHNDSIVAGDSLAGLPLDDNEVLEFTWPEDYELETHIPTPETVEENRAAWRGPVTFAADEPRIEVVKGGDGDGVLDDGDGQETDGVADELVGEMERTTIGAVFLIVLVLSGVIIGVRRRNGDAQHTSQQPQPAEEGSERSEDESPMELLSPEEQVLTVLEKHNGRTKQKRVAEESGWSAARTSQVVSELRDEGKIESFRIGRENVLTLPEVDIEGGDKSDEESGVESSDAGDDSTDSEE